VTITGASVIGKQAGRQAARSSWAAGTLTVIKQSASQHPAAEVCGVEPAASVDVKRGVGEQGGCYGAGRHGTPHDQHGRCCLAKLATH
jgi:hypothetical protein